MASDGNVFNMKVVRNVETVNFSFGNIFIRGRLLPQKRPEGAARKFAGQRACRGGKIAGKSLPGWKLSRPIRPEVEDGLK